MPLCQCRCGKGTKGGTFLPGHDAKLRAAIEKKVGGLLALDQLVDAAREVAEGRKAVDEFVTVARRVFEKVR